MAKKIINSVKDTGLKIVEDRDNFDYVYNREDLAFLKGRKFSNKRGFVKKFCADYYHRYWSYKNHKECRDKCLKFTDKWFEDKKPINKVFNIMNLGSLPFFIRFFSRSSICSGYL